MTVPIIGAPDIRGVSLSIMLKCKCGEPVLLVGVSNAQAQCACRLVYTLRGFVLNPDGTGGANVTVNFPSIGDTP
jgi:hypothetical protein